MTNIFFFSGTGNSFRAAEILAERLPGAQLFDIARSFRDGRFAIEADKLIFVYPAYAYEMPLMVRRFIKRAEIRCNYAAALVTYGSKQGGALAECKRLLRHKKIKLSYASRVPAPENFIPIFGAPKQKKKEKRLKLLEETAKSAAEDVAAGKRKRVCAFRPVSKAVSALFRAAKHLFPKMYKVNDKCTGCGFCVKLCPAGGIKMSMDNEQLTMGNEGQKEITNYKLQGTGGDQSTMNGGGKPVFDNKKCEMCMRCFNYCPLRALDYMRLKGAARYRHPAVTAEKLM